MANEIWAITVHREFAEAIASGKKRYEVRSFQPGVRGTIVVTISGEKVAYCLVDIVDVKMSAEVPELSEKERSYGTMAWQLENPRLCEPVPCIGKLGKWRWKGELPKVLKVRPGLLVTTKVEKRMEYYGYWVMPIRMYECFRPGDIGVVSEHCHIADGWSWVEFERNGQICRCQMWDHQIVILLNQNVQVNS